RAGAAVRTSRGPRSAGRARSRLVRAARRPRPARTRRRRRPARARRRRRPARTRRRRRARATRRRRADRVSPSAVCQGQLPPTPPTARHFAADSALPPAEFTAKCRARELAARGVVGQCRARGLTARGLTAQCRGGATGGAGYPHWAAVRRRRPAHPFHPGAMSLSSAALPEARTEPSVLTALRTPRLLVREVLAGLVVALALIPEAISF